MQTLIARLRRYIGDAAGASQVWTDDDLQEVLDRHQREARYYRLEGTPTIGPGAAVTFKIFNACVGDWEGSPEVVDAAFNVLSSSLYTEDLLVGRWTFAAQPYWPLYINGFFYDLNGAAAEILDAWIARLKGSVDLDVDGLNLKRSQKVNHLQEMRDRYAAQSWAEIGSINQTDFKPEPQHQGGSNWPY
jgi:hypothetical protein